MKKIIFKKLLEEAKKQIKYKSKTNIKLIICFVGIPGSGKTYLARKIEKRYKGIRINNDALRKIIDKKITKIEKERETILKQFLLKLLENYPFNNELLILDSGIERKYNEVYRISKAKKWKIFIIKMMVPKRLIIKRIKIKDMKRFKQHPEDIGRWFYEYKSFNKRIKADFVFKKNSDLKNLFSKLDCLLR